MITTALSRFTNVIGALLLISISALSPLQASAASKPPSTMDKLWKAADKALGSRKNIDIHYTSGIQTAQLYVGQYDYFDEKHLVTETYKRFVKWGSEIDDIQSVKTIDVFTNTMLTDSYGKESKAVVARVTMDTDKFKKYNWDKLKYQPIHNQIKADGSLYLHPAIQRSVDLSRVKLSF